MTQPPSAEAVARHELKTWPEYFQAVRRGDKTFEVRNDDRDFQLGDTLFLREWSPDGSGYTGETETRKATYVLKGGQWGIPTGLAVIALSAPTDPGVREAGAVTVTLATVIENLGDPSWRIEVNGVTVMWGDNREDAMAKAQTLEDAIAQLPQRGREGE